ncbi:hypothetical protein OUZ56_018755 [Daphnia magna]|uniref:Uncharacterized protein n=1 Tax=Daphnia magna TaxID=35525 RepID=A0ABQ9Z9R3_9CRUS|nr:hypothetical protein OUZ56_018755 [Daphnia magna]
MDWINISFRTHLWNPGVLIVVAEHSHLFRSQITYEKSIIHMKRGAYSGSPICSLCVRNCHPSRDYCPRPRKLYDDDT